MEEGTNQTPTSNENNGNSGNENNSSQFTGLIGAKKRGRPPGSKTKPISIGQENTRKPDPETNATMGQMESAKLIGTFSCALLELLESMVHNNCAKKIEKKMPEKLAEFKQLVSELQLQPKEKDIISETVAGIAVRYDFATKYARELVLGVTLGQYAIRQGALLRFTENITKSKTEIVVQKQDQTS